MPDVQLLPGDCLALLPTLPAQSVDLVLADLPYGVTQAAWDCPIDLTRLWAEYKRVLKPRGAVVLTASQPFTTTLISSNPAWFKYQWYWVKSKVTGYLNAKKQPLRKVEDVCVFYRRQPTFNPQMKQVPLRFVSRSGAYKGYGAHVPLSSSNGGQQYPFNVLNIPSDSTKLHPTQKPVALMAYLIRTYTDPGMTVLDNTLGSGTTGVAALQEGRAFIGIERDPAYFSIAQSRIAAVDPLLRGVACA